MKQTLDWISKMIIADTDGVPPVSSHLYHLSSYLWTSKHRLLNLCFLFFLASGACFAARQQTRSYRLLITPRNSPHPIINGSQCINIPTSISLNWDKSEMCVFRRNKLHSSSVMGCLITTLYWPTSLSNLISPLFYCYVLSPQFKLFSLNTYTQSQLLVEFKLQL